MLLEINGLSKRFGGLQAVNNLELKVDSGQIVGLIGPNGAGKTTVFNLITGVIKPDEGKVLFNGKDITKKSPHNIAALGIGRTFQLTPLFADFTTNENVLASQYLNAKSNFWDVLLNTRKYRSHEATANKESGKIIERVGLNKVRNELAKNLSHGYQKMLGIARALAVKPKLLMLDEPLGGLNTNEIAFTMEIMQKLQKEGVSILIIEHNMQILDICDQVFAINFGQNICYGCAEDVCNNPEVIKAYLGDGECSLE